MMDNYERKNVKWGMIYLLLAVVTIFILPYTVRVYTQPLANAASLQALNGDQVDFITYQTVNRWSYLGYLCFAIALFFAAMAYTRLEAVCKWRKEKEERPLRIAESMMRLPVADRKLAMQDMAETDMSMWLQVKQHMMKLKDQAEPQGHA